MDETMFNTEEHQIFRDSFTEICGQGNHAPCLQMGRTTAVPRAIWRRMGEQGFLLSWLPEEYGGLGLGFEYSVIINEELLRGNAFGVEVPLHSDMATPYIYSYALPEMKQRWLPKCTTGEVITAIGLTEPNAGSDLSAIRTRAVKDGDSYIINGQKTFISNGYNRGPDRLGGQDRSRCQTPGNEPDAGPRMRQDSITEGNL